MTKREHIKQTTENRISISHLRNHGTRVATAVLRKAADLNRSRQCHTLY